MEKIKNWWRDFAEKLAAWVILAAISGLTTAAIATRDLALDNKRTIDNHASLDELRETDLSRRLTTIEQRVAPGTGYSGTQGARLEDRVLELERRLHKHNEK